MENFITKTCRNCGSTKFKLWEELTDDDKFVIERLPDSKNYPLEKRKRQRFCKRCLYHLNSSDITV